MPAAPPPFGTSVGDSGTGLSVKWNLSIRDMSGDARSKAQGLTFP